MKKYFNLIVALVAMLFAGNSFAYTPPPAPAQGWYVVDQTGKLSEEQKAALNQKIDQVSKTTKNEFGILLLNTMDGDNIEDVAYTTFNTWGIGKRGLDNGVLIVVSLQERKSRIETGKGVGGEVTDLQSKQILDNTLRPFLKKGDFAGGFNATLDALSALIESRHNQKSAPVDTSVVNNAPASCALAAAGVGATDGGSSGVGWLVFVLLGGGFVVWRLRASAKRRAADRQAALDVEELRQNRLEAQRRESERRAAQRAETERLENANRLERERVARETVRPRVYPPVSTTLVAPPITPPKVATPEPNPFVRTAVVSAAAGVTAGAIAAEAARRAREREETNRQVQEEKSRRDEENRRRQRDEEDRRKRQRDDDDRRSSSSSSSDYGFGGGSSSGGGGGFDGGSSGGGGASSDW